MQDILSFIKDGANTLIKLPELINKDARGNERIWNITIIVYDIEPDICKNLIIERIEFDGVVEYYTVSGIKSGKHIVSERTKVESGKNKNRSNYTTKLTQAIMDINSLYNSKIKHGYNAEGGTKNQIPFAMALTNVSINDKRIKFPVISQPKMDGIMIMLTHDDHIFTRRHQEVVSLPYLLPEIQLLKLALLPLKRWYVLGELYEKQYKLQTLAGIVRSSEFDGVIKLNVFDMFDLDHVDMPFSKRLEYMSNIKSDYVVVIQFNIINTIDELAIEFNKQVNAGYEGIVIRRPDSSHEFCFDREIRSLNSLKLKERHDDEWPIVNYTCGQSGKDAGAVIFICAETDDGVKKRTSCLLPINERLTFNVVPNMSLDARKLLYNKFNEGIFKHYYMAEYTINYSDLSANGLPLQPKGKTFKDLDIEAMTQRLLNDK
jgi:hypothetical protein